MLGGACQVRVLTGVESGVDGGGVVRVDVGFDREALERVGDLGRQLRRDDLRAAGWQLTGPRRESDGLTWVHAARRFATPAEANHALGEVNPTSGPFRGFRLSRRQSLLRTTTRFRGTVDLTGGVQGFADEDELRRRLGPGPGLDLGTQTLERQLGIVADRDFRFQVVVRLPGDVESNAPSGHGGARWRTRFGERAELRATSRAWNGRRIALGLVALAAVGAGIALAVRGAAGGTPAPPEPG